MHRTGLGRKIFEYGSHRVIMVLEFAVKSGQLDHEQNSVRNKREKADRNRDLENLSGICMKIRMENRKFVFHP